MTLKDKWHYWTHRVFACPSCNKPTTRRNITWDHLQMMVYRCPWCGFEFRPKGFLRVGI